MAASQLKNDLNWKNTYPETESAANGGKGLPKSDGTTYEYTRVANNDYCLSAYSGKQGASAFHITGNGQTPQAGLCEGHEGPFDPNGSTAQGWTLHDAAEQNSWRSVAYGNGRFVAVASDGTNRVMTSTDGANWTARQVEQGQWISVTYGNGRFVAIAAHGTNTAMTSTDGVTWTAHPTPSIPGVAGSGLASVAYGNGRFVAVGHHGSNRVMTSTDGTSWVAHPAPTISGGNTTSDRLVAYGNGRFIAVAGSGAQSIMTSTDGQNWTVHTTPATRSIRSVAYGGGKFIATSGDSINDVEGKVMTSTDGQTWTTTLSGGSGVSTGGWFPVYGNGRFIVGTTNYNVLVTSAGGQNWNNITVPQSGNWRMAYGNGCFVGVSNSGAKRVIRSCE